VFWSTETSRNECCTSRNSILQHARSRTMSQHYDEPARAQLQAHIENVLARRKTIFARWDDLWTQLERAAEQYSQGLKRFSQDPLPSAQETLEAIDGCIGAIAKVTNYLGNTVTFDWHFRNERGYLIQSESPKRWRHLTKELIALRSNLSAKADELRRFCQGSKTYAATAGDCQDLFQWRVLEVGRQLLGSQVGRDDGPLITFFQLALSPVLGNSTPPAPTLRSFARRNP